MGKNEINWAIFSGKTLLPFTIRRTRKQCLRDFLFKRARYRLDDHESCKKVVINEYSPAND